MIAVAVALVVAYLWWLTPQGFRRVDRYLAVLERRIPVPEVERPPSEPIPADLLIQAREAYSEKWAQDQAIDALYDSRAQLGSWDNVRVAVKAGGF